MERKINIKTIATLGLLSLAAFSCQKKADDVVASKKLYVASGQCYSGSGITTYTAAQSSRVVTIWDTDSGAASGVFTDLNFGTNVSTGTVPQSMIDQGSTILLLTENATNGGDRKVFKVSKNDPNGVYTVFANDPTALTPTAGHVTRSIALDADGTLLFSKSIATEKLNTVGVRIAKGGTNPWINPAAATGTCFTAAATQIQQIAMMTPFTATNQGKVLYIHAGNTAAVNRIGMIQRTGLVSTTATDCAGSNPAGGLSAVAHTNAPNLPAGLTAFVGTGPSITSMVYIPTPAPATTTGKVIVSYSASVPGQTENSVALGLNYAIVMWDITETSDTAATVTNPVILYKDESIVWAVSSMAYDSSTSSLYVAVGGSPSQINQVTANYGYNIEKFTLNITTPQLTRVAPSNHPFIIGNANTKCISNMMISDN